MNKYIENEISTIIDNSLLLLSTVNFDIVDSLLEKTPPEMSGDLSYLVLQLTKKFNNEMQELFSKQNK